MNRGMVEVPVGVPMVCHRGRVAQRKEEEKDVGVCGEAHEINVNPDEKGRVVGAEENDFWMHPGGDDDRSVGLLAEVNVKSRALGNFVLHSVAEVVAVDSMPDC